MSFLGVFFLILASLAAIFFTPYLTYVLWAEKKHLWLITFYLLIVVPFIMVLIFFESYLFYWTFIILAMFYFYCYALRFSVNSWIREKDWRDKFLLDKLKNDVLSDLDNKHPMK